LHGRRARGKGRARLQRLLGDHALANVVRQHEIQPLACPENLSDGDLDVNDRAVFSAMLLCADPWTRRTRGPRADRLRPPGAWQLDVRHRHREELLTRVAVAPDGRIVDPGEGFGRTDLR
jgi:hypothetical protein